MARLEAAFFFHSKVPVVFAGISEDANYGYVFVQEPGKACLKCVFPNMEPDPSGGGCQGHMGDMGYVLTGYVSFALDTLFVDHPLRKRNWNLVKLYLNGLPNLKVRVKKREGCEFCSK